ncbi:saccharopine dehydrogenase NADP-binding domain-containing protein [Flavobacterium sp. CYK-55]|uniref:saccharopine dehydrogenase family protein n=1 Tax=Flavobacterium sp. CYK-55 TaxID=2835529 RepID=UPI001BD0822E|nr:saccharopine dehydrogenase C-terminal domain-containing protein [Flavobacterium sp. CYK-55]MBS7785835.1 saccharopine dehydrogenase NADP-binding domain-containing protein [Flavobacterium sp. CYK-55]
MRNILIIGAGRSASSLIEYLLQKSNSEQLHLTIADLSVELAQKKTNNHPNATAIALDINHADERQAQIQKADLVISMLPAHMHIEVAQDCVTYKKHMVTASYISDAMQNLNQAAKANGLVFMNEAGLDPGIDHMSAMKIIDEIREKGGKIFSFESYCGGLIAPESDNNAWNYKFTWAPRNVVLAGQGGAAKFIHEGTYKYIPYQKLFQRTDALEVTGYGSFETYANRDSLKYRSVYGLEDISTLLRGTIRRAGYSRAWDAFVQLGMTDDSYTIDHSEQMSYRDYVCLFLPYSSPENTEKQFCAQVGIAQTDDVWRKFAELDLFSNTKKVGLKNATPAQILEKILTENWTLEPSDKDMIVMYHKFGYELDGQKKQIDSQMVCIGQDQIYTAMAKTVGLPVAMAALRILNKQITQPGVQLPISKEVYLPLLAELETYGIHFTETEKPYIG